jgi:hypothetical protein
MRGERGHGEPPADFATFDMVGVLGTNILYGIGKKRPEVIQVVRSRRCRVLLVGGALVEWVWERLSGPIGILLDG